MLATMWYRIVLSCHLVGSSPRYNKWLTFTYVGRGTKHITDIFRRTNLKVAYETKNTIEHFLILKPLIQDRYLKSGMYKFKYLDCNKKYMGQMGKSFYHMYKEHHQDFKTRNKRLNFARHPIENNHPVVCVKIIHIIRKKGV